MRAAGLEDVDPQAVELELSPGEVERAVLGERRDMLVEQLDQVAEPRIAQGQVVERRVGCIAAIAMRLRPIDPRAVGAREFARGVLQLLDQIGVAEIRLVEARREQAARAYAASLSATSFMNRTSSPSASHFASAATAPSMSDSGSISALA